MKVFEFFIRLLAAFGILDVLFLMYCWMESKMSFGGARLVSVQPNVISTSCSIRFEKVMRSAEICSSTGCWAKCWIRQKSFHCVFHDRKSRRPTSCSSLSRLDVLIGRLTPAGWGGGWGRGWGWGRGGGCGCGEHLVGGEVREANRDTHCSICLEETNRTTLFSRGAHEVFGTIIQLLAGALASTCYRVSRRRQTDDDDETSPLVVKKESLTRVTNLHIIQFYLFILFIICFSFCDQFLRPWRGITATDVEFLQIKIQNGMRKSFSGCALLFNQVTGNVASGFLWDFQNVEMSNLNTW